MAKYLLRVVNVSAAKHPQWEEVDEYVFNNRRLAVWDDTNLPRYNPDTYAIINGADLILQGVIPTAHLPYFCRMAGVTEIPQGTYNLWGNPQYIQVLGRQGTVRLHRIGTPQESDFVRKGQRPPKEDGLAKAA